MAKYFSKSLSFSTVCHTAVLLTKALNVDDPSETFQFFFMWLSQVDVY